jgi:hypothetical protein
VSIERNASHEGIVGKGTVSRDLDYRPISCLLATNGIRTLTVPLSNDIVRQGLSPCTIQSQCYLYNILRVPNAAWRQFLKTVLGFSADQLNALLITAYVLLYVGTLSYKYYFIRFSWRLVFQAGILLNCFFSSFQILLIKGKTFGLSPFLFALGDDVFADLISGIQFLVRWRGIDVWYNVITLSSRLTLPGIYSHLQS